MKVLKKIITFLMLGIIFFPLNSVSASANSNVAMTVISEYDMYKQIKETSVNDLLTAGYSEATIKEYKETDYVGVLFKRAELSKDELINLGYTDDQIEIFQNFTGTEDEINTLSASLTFSLSYVRSSISNNSTWCDVKVSWSWSQCPIFTQEDIVALAWTDGMYCDTSSAVNSTYYLWYSKSNNAYVNGSYGDITAVLNTGVYTQKILFH